MVGVVRVQDPAPKRGAHEELTSPHAEEQD